MRPARHLRHVPVVRTCCVPVARCRRFRVLCRVHVHKDLSALPELATAPSTRPEAVAGLRRGIWVGLDQAHVMGVELMAAILTWAGIGSLIDRALGSGPWFLAIGALVGNFAGLYLVWMRSARMNARDERERSEALLAQAQEADRAS